MAPVNPMVTITVVLFTLDARLALITVVMIVPTLTAVDETVVEPSDQTVRAYLKGTTLTYPVALDNKYAIWRALNNEYWPAEYLIDTSGRIRYRAFGEGHDAATERELVEQDWLRRTEDFSEGIKAMADRRLPNFQGR